MKPKDYLMQIRHAKRRIKEIETEILEIREAMTSLSCWLGSGGSPSSNQEIKSPQEKLMNQLLEHEDELVEEQRKLFDLKRFIVSQIDMITTEDGNCRDLLYDRYVEGHSLERVAVDMGYNYAYTRRLHGRALALFGERFLKR